jgi:RHS repeat-associated protein
VENAAGTSCEQDIDYYPYGGVEDDYCITPVPQNYKFTGKERDNESGLDDFDARYYASTMGRFMTPDWDTKPVTVPYAKFGDPQTLDLYGYVENSPVDRMDPTGHFTPPGQEMSFACDGSSECMERETGDRQQGQTQRETQYSGVQNKERRAGIAKRAKKYKGSTDWAYGKKKGVFACNTWKCNEFVGDVTKEAGAPAEIHGRYPLAGEWADKKTKIDNWRVLGPDEQPEAGDVAAYKIPGCQGCTGHSGIVVGADSGGVHVMAAHADVVGPDDKFQPTNPAVVYRRYTGDEQ